MPPILATLVLIAVANGAPILARRVMGARLGRPLDGGFRLGDGRPLFGSSKTIRGIVAALAATSLAALLLGLPWSLGLAVAAAAMAGDLASSFVKRRLGLAPGARATGLDQVPEAALPALAAAGALPLSPLDIAAVVLLFLLGAILLSRLLHAWGIRRRPW